MILSLKQPYDVATMRIPAKTKTISLALGLFFSSSVWAQALQLQHQLALANDASLQAKLHSHQATKEQEKIANMAFIPVLSANANKTYDIEQGAHSDSYSATLALNLNLEALYAIDSARASIQQSSLNLQADKQQLRADIISAYFNVVKHQAQLDSINAQIKSANQSLATIQKQRQLGLATSLQASKVDNNVQELQLSLLKAQQALQQARNTLTLSTNETINDDFPGISLATSLPVLDSLELDFWWDIAQQHSLSLLAAKAGVQKSYHDYQQTDAQKYPTGSISAKHDSALSDMIMFSITGKLYDAGLNQSQTQIARLNWLANQQALTANQRTTKQALSNVLYNLRNNKQQIQLQENLLATAITSLAATHKEYELGVTDLVAVLEAEQNVATNEVDLIQARYDQIIYQSDLKRLTGRLKQGDLQQYDALLN